MSIREATSGVRRLALFCIVLATSITLTDLLIDQGLRRIRTGTFGVFNRIVDGTINAAILVTGSSRALTHYDPRVITAHTGRNSWNIGVNGSQTDMHLAVLKTYLAHNEPPELLIHNLDSFAFKTSRAGIADPEHYVPYLNEPPVFNALRSLDHKWWKARYLPLYGYAVEDMNFSWARGLAALVGYQPPEMRYYGFEPRDRVWNEDFARFRQARPNGVRFEVEPEGVRDFVELIRVATACGSRVLLVYSPVYIEMQRLETDRTAMFARFQQIATEYGATVWDFGSSDISRRQEYFYNSQHLNAKGAALFSEELAKRITAELLAGRSSGPNEISSTKPRKDTSCL